MLQTNGPGEQDEEEQQQQKHDEEMWEHEQEQEEDPDELQPGDHVVETEELEEEEVKLQYLYDLEDRDRHGNGRPCDFLYNIALEEGYSSWQANQYGYAHGEETYNESRRPSRGFPWEDLPSHVYPSQGLMAKRRERVEKQRRHRKLEWVYEFLEERSHRLTTKAEKRVGRAAISMMVAEIVVNVMEMSEGILFRWLKGDVSFVITGFAGIVMDGCMVCIVYISSVVSQDIM